jgi:sugar-phosphatase
VVVEDAAAGVLAGLNAGSHVIAVNVPADRPVWMKPTLCWIH